MKESEGMPENMKVKKVKKANTGKIRKRKLLR
jgi:hypothetical protein